MPSLFNWFFVFVEHYSSPKGSSQAFATRFPIKNRESLTIAQSLVQKSFNFNLVSR